MVRKLTLRSEHLAELDTDDLRDVAGGVSGTTCISNMVISLCGCFTDYCSIDVC